MVEVLKQRKEFKGASISATALQDWKSTKGPLRDRGFDQGKEFWDAPEK